MSTTARPSESEEKSATVDKPVTCSRVTSNIGKSTVATARTHNCNHGKFMNKGKNPPLNLTDFSQLLSDYQKFNSCFLVHYL